MKLKSIMTLSILKDVTVELIRCHNWNECGRSSGVANFVTTDVLGVRF